MSVETPYLTAALRYAANGYSVIPCEEGGKRALVSWTEWQGKRATPEQIRLWWSANPNANVGIITGKISGLVVVDIDTYKGARVPEDITRQGFSNLLVSRTPRGGLHVFFPYPEGATNVPNQVDKSTHIDVRGDGGYVLAEPSTIDGSDTRYKFLKANLELAGRAPAWALGRRETEPELDFTPVRDSEGWLSQTLTNGLGGEGGRNDTAARLAGYLSGKGIPPDVALIVVREANAKGPDPLPDSEIRTTVLSVYKTTGKREGEKKAAALEIVPANQSLQRFRGHVTDWIVPGWLPKSTCGFIVSPPECYKTWLMLDLALSITRGTSFMGSPVKIKGPVIYFQQEDFWGDLDQRARVINASKVDRLCALYEDGEDIVYTGELYPESFYMPADPSMRMDLAEEAMVSRLEEYIAQIRPTLVMLDPLYSALDLGDDYMASSVKRHLMRFKDLRDKYGTAFLLAHHTKKSAGKGREGIYGSQLLNAWLETGWQIRKPNEDVPNSVTVRRHFKTAGAEQTMRLLFDISTKDEDYGYSVEMEDYVEEEGGDTLPNPNSNPVLRTAILEALDLDSLSSEEVSKMVRRGEPECVRQLLIMQGEGLVGTDSGGSKWKKLTTLHA